MWEASYIGRGRRETNSSCVINLVIPLDDVLKKKRVRIINLTANIR